MTLSPLWADVRVATARPSWSPIGGWFGSAGVGSVEAGGPDADAVGGAETEADEGVSAVVAEKVAEDGDAEDCSALGKPHDMTDTASVMITNKPATILRMILL